MCAPTTNCQQRGNDVTLPYIDPCWFFEDAVASLTTRHWSRLHASRRKKLANQDVAHFVDQSQLTTYEYKYRPSSEAQPTSYPDLTLKGPPTQDKAEEARTPSPPPPRGREEEEGERVVLEVLSCREAK